MMEIRNPVWNASGGIDCEVDHPQLGWIPFTARPDDPEGSGVYDVASSMKPAPFTPRIEDPAAALAEERAAMVCSRFQAKAAMMNAGILQQVEALMAKAPALDQLAWAEAIEYRRSSPMINTLAATFGLSDTQIDDLFRAAMSIAA